MVHNHLRFGGLRMGSLWFGVYVLWLTAFAMSGPLMEPGARLAWFALPHALALMGWGLWGDSRRLQTVLPVATVLTVGATAGYAALPAGQGGAMAPWAAVFLGLAAAPLSLRAGEWLALQRRPVIAAAVGLGLGNLCSVALDELPAPDAFKLILLAVLLVGLAWPRPASQRHRATSHHASQTLKVFAPLLLFLTAFQVVSGLMYGHLWPAYRQHAAIVGLELMFYIASVGLVSRWVNTHGLACALMAVLLSLASFSLYASLDTPWGSSGAIYLMMMATGIVDLLLLALILGQRDVLRAYGYGVGALVLGIAMGDLLSLALPAPPLPAGFSALMFLTLAMVGLTAWRFAGLPRLDGSSPLSDGPAESVADDAIRSHTADETNIPALPPQLAALLSEQEQRVVMACATGAPYREIAHTLGISESSVKTYMQRSFRKLGIYRRDQLAPLLGLQPTRMQPGDESTEVAA